MARRGRPLDSEARQYAVKEIRELYNKLKPRIKRLQDKYGDLPAVETFYDKGLDKLSTKGKTLEQLGELKTDLEYVSSLKTSYVSGAKNYNQYVAEWIDLYDRDRASYDTIMTLYNRMVEENELAEKFKYEIIEEIYTLVETRDGISGEEMHNLVRKKFEELYLSTVSKDVLGGTSYETTGGKVR